MIGAPRLLMVASRVTCGSWEWRAGEKAALDRAGISQVGSGMDGVVLAVLVVSPRSLFGLRYSEGRDSTVLPTFVRIPEGQSLPGCMGSQPPLVYAMNALACCCLARPCGDLDHHNDQRFWAALLFFWR